MKKSAEQTRMYFLSNQFEIIHSELTTNYNPVSVGGSMHYSVNDQRFDMHYEMELGIVLSGKLERVTGNNKSMLESGQVWMHSTWEPHGYRIAEVPCETVVIVFRPEVLFELKLFNHSDDWLSMFYCKPVNRPQTNIGNKEDVISIAKQIQKVTLKPDEIRINLLQVYLMQLMIFLEQDRKIDKSALNLASNRLVRIQPAIQLAFGTKEFIPEKHAADLCNLSLSTFRKEFGGVMNISFPKFSLRYRLKQASLMLGKTSNSIKDIAFQHGFFDLSHFYRDFKDHFGVTPKEYRDNSV